MNEGVTRRGFLGGMTGLAAFNVMQTATALGSQANSRVEVGVIGLGGRGDMIAQFIQEHGGYHIASVADYFREVAEKAGERFGVPKQRCFSGLSACRRLLESGVDAVFLETPPYCFPDHAEAAVGAGCHVYMAKPVACDVPGCLRVRDAAAKAGEKNRVFLVDFQTRTDPFFIEGVERVRRGDLGRIGLLSSLYSDEGFSDPPLTATVESRLQHLVWVNDDALGGGYLVNAGIHAVDVALWLAGSVPVSATGASGIARADAHGDSHDVYSITYEFADGLVLNHRGEHLKNRFGFHADCTAHCRDGCLETGYASRVFIESGKNAWPGGEVKDLYVAGAKRNIAAFHENVTTGKCANPTVEPSINATLAVLLGREAAAKRSRVAWADFIAENRRLEPNLDGLQA